MPIVSYSEAALAQVANNLLDNAIKYSDKPLCEINIDFEELDNEYAILISDNGIGVLEKNREKIYGVSLAAGLFYCNIEEPDLPQESNYYSYP